MATIVQVLIGLVAFLHVFFFVLEAFLWNTPYGRKTFRLTPEFAKQSAVLAANQGVYNLFLAAGLVWALILGATTIGWPITIFFLSCVIVAGIVGGITSNPRIFIIQGVPAIAALALAHFV